MKFFEWLGKALSEDTGNPSSVRLNIFIAVVALIPTVAFTMIYVCYFKPDLISSTLITVVGFITSLFGIKVWQKKNESDPPDKPTVQ